MKDGTARKIKTKKLARLLGVDLAYAVGVLNMLWSDFAPREAARGDVGRHTDGDIVAELGTSLEPARVIASLLEAGFLCQDDSHRLVIHDWPDHLEQRVKHRLARVGQDPIQCQCRTSGSVPSDPKSVSDSGVNARTDAVRTASGPARGSGLGIGQAVGRSDGVRTACPAEHPVAPKVRETYRMGGCHNVPLCHEHFVAKQRASGTLAANWDEAERAWALRHISYGGPCQRKPTPADNDREQAGRKREQAAERRAPRGEPEPEERPTVPIPRSSSGKVDFRALAAAASKKAATA